MLYSAARDGGLDPKEFHRLCDGAGPTLVAIRDEKGSVSLSTCIEFFIYMRRHVEIDM